MSLLIPTRSGPVELHELGSGPPLLLLHAAGHDHHDFDAVAPALARRHRTLAVDWPGAHGSRSAAPSPPHTASTVLYSGVLADVVDALDPDPAVLVGSSIGGTAALRLAVERPERVRGLVLVDSGGFAPMNAFTRLFCRLKGSPWITARVEGRFARWHLHRRTETVVDRLRRIDEARGDATWAAVTAAIWRSFAWPESDVRELAPRLRVPTLVVWGRRDPVLRVEQGRLAARLIPGAELVELDTGHLPFAEAPEEFLAAIDGFLDRLPDAALARSA